jgi:hypothetical protein
LKVNEPDVVYQVFPDEVVIINLRLGTYYSLDKIGADIFGMIAAGGSLHEVERLIAARWSDVPPKFVPDFMRHLFRQGILTNVEPEVSTAAEAYPARELQPYEEPLLNTYDDMQALLLLDPVHDVDEQGWPNKAVKE